VLLDRVLELLEPALDGPDAVVVDATVGLGGHAGALLAAHPRLRLIGLDRDPDALAAARARLAPAGGRVELVHAVFDQLAEVLARLGHPRVQGVLFDLGVSSLQLDADERGFSYARDTRLDMRMDPTAGRTAADVLAAYGVDELTRILRDFGEERFARRIARAVVARRAAEPVTTSAQLVDVVRRAVPAPARRTGGNPAKRTFQALRIEVNGELTALAGALPAALDALAGSGRIVALSYHSLEDRLVKRALAVRADAAVPPEMPFVPAAAAPTLRLLTRGAEAAGPAEVARNPRAASVRLRAAERIRPPPGADSPGSTATTSTTGGAP
jgi:16S rRNA (cytosine1402-N4)-methyltransferase